MWGYLREIYEREWCDFKECIRENAKMNSTIAWVRAWMGFDVRTAANKCNISSSIPLYKDLRNTVQLN